MRFIQSVYKVQVAGCCSGVLTSLSLNLKASSISSAESSSVTSPSSKSWSKVAGSFLAFKKRNFCHMRLCALLNPTGCFKSPGIINEELIKSSQNASHRLSPRTMWSFFGSKTYSFILFVFLGCREKG